MGALTDAFGVLIPLASCYRCAAVEDVAGGCAAQDRLHIGVHLALVVMQAKGVYLFVRATITQSCKGVESLSQKGAQGAAVLMDTSNDYESIRPLSYFFGIRVKGSVLSFSSLTPNL